MSELRSCNGWSNYPTWNMAMWIDNEQAWLEEAEALARDNRDDADQLGEYLKAMMLNDREEAQNASPFEDILGWALDFIDWSEIARGIIDALDDDEDEDEGDDEPDDDEPEWVYFVPGRR